MNFDPLQFITQEHPVYSHAQLAHIVCSAGFRWVQVRVKNKQGREFEKVAAEVLEVCNKFGAVCIVNDSVEIARNIGAHGVHLGVHDVPVNEARKTLGENVIIGGTANTYNEARSQIEGGADYLGVGPFRYTETKKNLSPILGLGGYSDFKLFSKPIVAVGGIIASDLKVLLTSGVDGVAISGAISQAKDPQLAAEIFVKEFQRTRPSRAKRIVHGLT